MKPGRSCCSWLSFTLIYIEYMPMPVLSKREFDAELQRMGVFLRLDT